MASTTVKDLLKLSLFSVVVFMVTLSGVSDAAHIPTTTTTTTTAHVTSQSSASIVVTSTSTSNAKSQESHYDVIRSEQLTSNGRQRSEESLEVQNNDQRHADESEDDVIVTREKRDVRRRRSVGCNPCQSTDRTSRETDHVVRSIVAVLDGFDRDQLDVAKARVNSLIEFYEQKIDATKPDHDIGSPAIRQQHANLQFPALPFNIEKEHIATERARELLDDLYEALYFANSRLERIIQKEQQYCRVRHCSDVTAQTQRLLKLNSDVSTVLCRLYTHMRPVGCTHANHHQRGLDGDRDAMFYQFYVTLSYIEQALIMTGQLVYLAEHDLLL